jgi:TonB-dependent SusC/RagA subfamily outer membrane receptor
MVPLMTGGGAIAAGGRGRVGGGSTMATGQPGDTLVRFPILAPFRNNPPLYVVDGVPLVNTTNTSADFAGLDIANVEIIRGAAASALYGSKADGGVISITTKRKAARDLLQRGKDTVSSGDVRIVPGSLTAGKISSVTLAPPTDSGVVQSQSIRGKVLGLAPDTLSRFTRFMQALTDSIPGAPRDSSIVQIRSVASPFEAGAPLYVVDGIALTYLEATTHDFSDLDIKSIQVIRGANATARYGPRASNGAIVISSTPKPAVPVAPPTRTDTLRGRGR